MPCIIQIGLYVSLKFPFGTNGGKRQLDGVVNNKISDKKTRLLYNFTFFLLKFHIILYICNLLKL